MIGKKLIVTFFECIEYSICYEADIKTTVFGVSATHIEVV